MTTETEEYRPTWNDINRISKDCRDHGENIAILIAQTQQRIHATLREVLIVGHKLRQARKVVGRAKWSRYLAESCPGIGEEEARHYMRISGSKNISDLNNPKMLLRACAAMGLFEPTQTKCERSPYM
jgi:hypothetical protein